MTLNNAYKLNTSNKDVLFWILYSTSKNNAVHFAQDGNMAFLCAGWETITQKELREGTIQVDPNVIPYWIWIDLLNKDIVECSSIEAQQTFENPKKVQTMLRKTKRVSSLVPTKKRQKRTLQMPLQTSDLLQLIINSHLNNLVKNFVKTWQTKPPNSSSSLQLSSLQL